jgi:hypothetical protein
MENENIWRAVSVLPDNLSDMMPGSDCGAQGGHSVVETMPGATARSIMKRNGVYPGTPLVIRFLPGTS